MRCRPAATLLVCVVLGAALVAGDGRRPAAGSPPANPATTWCEADRDPVPAELAGELAARYPARRFSAAVVDDHGCTWVLHPERRMTTASVLKIEVMVGAGELSDCCSCMTITRISAHGFGASAFAPAHPPVPS